jgi:choline kinase
VRAIILAAGLGRRLTPPGETPPPKCLLRFGGKTLLERHLRLLRAAGVNDVVLAVGYARERVAAELDTIAWSPRPRLVFNPEYERGSMISLHTVGDHLTGDVIVMDADVLYDGRMLAALCADAAADRALIDFGFEPGDEPVKLCLRAGKPVELRKQVDPSIAYDRCGESVGFFRFRHDTARRLAEITRAYVESGRGDLPHEEALRDLLQERSAHFDCADVTPLPWLEIDFPQDVVRARDEILPRLETLP